jgi:hypothetical protein
MWSPAGGRATDGGAPTKLCQRKAIFKSEVRALTLSLPRMLHGTFPPPARHRENTEDKQQREELEAPGGPRGGFLLDLLPSPSSFPGLRGTQAASELLSGASSIAYLSGRCILHPSPQTSGGPKSLLVKSISRLLITKR